MPHWSSILRTNFTSLPQLATFLELSPDQVSQLLARSPFVLNLPRRLAEKIAKGTLDDPLLRQFIPLQLEELSPAEFTEDPLEERHYRKTSKLLHKYSGRVLLTTTSACAMHCRYCFRQNFPYERSLKGFESEISYIAEHVDIHEVILSGGDPLSLPDPVLGALLDSLSTLSHVKRIRFHTRFPIGIPERIDAEFLRMLSKTPQQIIFVIHVNHMAEMDEQIWKALRQLQTAGLPVLSQTVLLQGVNDSVEVLSALFIGLVNRGIIPYYLHQLDRVKGTAHFEVMKEKGKELLHALQAKLPGYALPRFAQELPEKPSKTFLF